MYQWLFRSSQIGVLRVSKATIYANAGAAVALLLLRSLYTIIACSHIDPQFHDTRKGNNKLLLDSGYQIEKFETGIPKDCRNDWMSLLI